MKKYYSWAYSEYSEEWSQPLNSIDECIKEAKEDGIEDFVFIGECKDVEVYGNACADYVIEDIENNFDIDLNISEEDEKDLEDRLNEVIAQWIVERKIGDGCYTVENIKRYKVI